MRPENVFDHPPTDGVVIFDAGDELSATVARQAGEKAVPVRVFDVRAIVAR
jgi:hypothetical protein